MFLYSQLEEEEEEEEEEESTTVAETANTICSITITANCDHHYSSFHHPLYIDTQIDEL
jgi:hypothetical protein